MTQNGDRTFKKTADGDVFELEALRRPKWAMTIYVLVPNQEIIKKATALLPIAQAMAKARKKHAQFLAESAHALDLRTNSAYEIAQDAAQEASERAAKLQLLAKGLSSDERLVVTLADWVEIFEFFKQTYPVGRQVPQEGVA